MHDPKNETVASTLREFVSSAFGLATIGILVVILIGLGRPLVEARLQQAKPASTAS